ADGLDEGVVVRLAEGDPAVPRAVGGAAQAGDQVVREERAADLLRLERRLVLGAGGEQRLAAAGDVVGEADLEGGGQAPALLAQECAALAAVDDGQAHGGATRAQA